MEPNDVGIDEFMELMRMIKAEPYISINTGLGTAQQAADEVEYVNGSATTPLGRLRASYGHPKPYNVKYWAVGNEMFGTWQLGYMTIDKYLPKHNQVAAAMWKSTRPSNSSASATSAPAPPWDSGARSCSVIAPPT